MRSYVLILYIFAILPLSAADPRLGSSSVSLGVGAAFPASGYHTGPFHSGPAFAGEFEFRLLKFLAATIGVENYLLSVEHFGKFPVPDTRERLTLMPFGLRGVVPIADGRGELFLGTGGAPFWTSDDFLGIFKDAALWHWNGGFRISLGRARRFRLGPTARYYRDLGRPTQQWVSVTADFSYRFGR